MTEPAKNEQLSSLGWALGGQALGGVTIASLLSPYVKTIARAAGAPFDAEDRRVMKALKRDIRSSPEFDARASVMERLTARRGEVPSVVSTYRRGAGLGREPGGASYDSTTGTINLSKGQAGPALLAHELGHKAGAKALLSAHKLGRFLSNLAGVGALASSDQDTSRNFALAGTALGGLTLASELDASRRGYQLLRTAGSSKARALKSFIGVPTYALMAGIPLLSHKAKELMGGFAPETSKQAKEGQNDNYAAQGALAAAALPLAAHLDYETRQLPGHRRDIRQVVAQAAKENKIHEVLKPQNALRGQMRLGDVILNSNEHIGWKDLLKNPNAGNMNTASLMGSGSPFVHASMSTSGGRGIDMGDADKATPHRRLLDDLSFRLRNKGRAPTALNPSGPFRASKDVTAALARVGEDVFWTGGYEDTPNTAVIRRLRGIEGADPKALATSMLENSQKPYSKLRAALSGLAHMALPFGHKLPGLRKLEGLGTFCSDGVCASLPKGLNIPSGATSFPHMVAGPLNSELVGIGLNRGAMATANAGLKGSARLESAAMNALNKTLTNASGLRRLGAAGFIASLAGAGALAGNMLSASKPSPAS